MRYAALWLLTTSTVLAQDPAPAGQLRSGPEVGSLLRPCNVYAPSGPRAGLTLDVAGVIGDGPGAILFIHEISRNTAPMIRAIDKLAQSHRILGLDAFAVRIAADRTAAERQIKQTSGALRMIHPMVISVDGAEGPGDYALNKRCTLTLVVAKDGKIHSSVGFTDTGQNDVALMQRSIEAASGELPKDPGELRRLALASLPADASALRELAAQLALEQHWQSQQAPPGNNNRRNNRRNAGRGMRQQNDPPRPETIRPNAAAGKKREGAPPKDAELMASLRPFIRKDATPEQVDEIYAKIVARVGDDAALRSEAVEMFRLMLSLDYGSEAARTKAKAYVEEHGPKKDAGKSGR